MTTDYIDSQINMFPSFKECPLCHSTNTEVKIDVALATYPCKYNYHCKDCNEWFLSTDCLVIVNDPLYANEPTLATPESNYPMGWVCPKCGASVSPYQSYCPCCNGTNLTPTGTCETSGASSVGYSGKFVGEIKGVKEDNGNK